MLKCYRKETKKKAIPITVVFKKSFSSWIKTQSKQVKTWINQSNFYLESGYHTLLPNNDGSIKTVIIILNDPNDFWIFGQLPGILPKGIYYLNLKTNLEFIHRLILFWGLGSYQFFKYKTGKGNDNISKLLIPEKINLSEIENVISSTYFVRNLINMPPNEMTPSCLEKIALQLSKAYQAKIRVISGQDLLKKGYNAIYYVGKASKHQPRLIELKWGNKNHPKLVLVGKGVCFDSGGLNIKFSHHMRFMKKDMAGAAHVLGFSKMIMEANLPICLRVFIPAIENMVNENAYRPGDIIYMKNGKTVEIENTDAEGRLIMADALADAVSENPNLLIDFATLTDGAEVALGPDYSAMFTNRDELAISLSLHARHEHEFIWQFPLHSPYKRLLSSSIADISNSGTENYAGAITAALFLKEFIPDTIPWIHFDITAWNKKGGLGKIQGGEAVNLRSLFKFITKDFLSRC